MGNPADLFPPDGTPRHGVQGTVTRAPDDALDTIDVAWGADGDDGAGEEQAVEVGVRWASNGRLPAVNDTAILFNDDRGDPHAVVFATGAAFTPDSTAAVAALDTRIDALEAKRSVAGTVAADGSESSTEFSVVKNTTGDYTVTFTQPFSSAPSVIVGAGASVAYYEAKLYGGSTVTTSTFRVLCYLTDSPHASFDGQFHFSAIGPS